MGDLLPGSLVLTSSSKSLSSSYSYWGLKSCFPVGKSVLRSNISPSAKPPPSTGEHTERISGSNIEQRPLTTRKVLRGRSQNRTICIKGERPIDKTRRSPSRKYEEFGIEESAA